jgi:carboxypeptidase Taq
MPHQGVDFRAEQIALIEKILQQKILDPKIQQFIQTSSQDHTVIRQQVLLKDEVIKHSIPEDFSVSLARHTVQSIESWKIARQKNDFSLFRDDLKQMVVMQQRLADYIRQDKSRYDALLSFYDADLTFAQIHQIFDPLQKKLTKLVQEGNHPKRQYVPIFATIEEQKLVCQKLVEWICSQARIDASTHPFCDMLGPKDIRLTTRYNENDIQEAIYSTLHELGHALYDAQLPHTLPYPLNQALSLTVHESQSKLFETCIGGSEEFLTVLHHLLSQTLKKFDLSLEAFIESRKAITKNPIRIEADELSYPLHIIFRTKIEHDLIEGILDVDALPKTFHQYQKELLHLDVNTDKEGCLQDIHWACGSFGYFPTYLTGCMFAADQWHLMQQLQIHSGIHSKNFESIKMWLKEHIHSKGSTLDLKKLIQHSTKLSLDDNRYFNYLQKRFL